MPITAIIFIVLFLPIAIAIEKHRRNYIKKEIQKGTEETLKGNNYKVKVPFQYGTPMCYTTYNSIKRGIDKNVNEIHNSQNIQEPKQ